MSAVPAPTAFAFDDSRVNWRRLGDFEHFVYTVFAVDKEREIADFALKFSAGEKIFPHRHRADTTTFVVQGEHVIYDLDGHATEHRQSASFTASQADAEPHAEGGGAEGAVVIYNTRGSADGVVFDVLDDHAAVVGTLTIDDLAQLFAAQGNVPGA